MASANVSFRLVLLIFFLRVISAASPVPQLDIISKPFTNIAHVFGDSSAIELSADGRWAAFCSTGNGLATNDNNGQKIDLFLTDLQSGETRLVSRNIRGTSANGDSLVEGISADGRFVLFESGANDLVARDLNASSDVFLYDSDMGKITLVSRSPTGPAAGDSGAAVMTRNGQFVLFESDAENIDPRDQNSATDLFLFNRETGTTELVTLNFNNTAATSGPFAPIEIGSYQASVSEDGRYVAYSSAATNVVSAPLPTNFLAQLYLRDMIAGTNLWVSQSVPLTNTIFPPSTPVLSANGMVLAFLSSSLVAGPQSPFWLHIYSVSSNVLTEVPAPADAPANSTIDEFALSANGKVVAYTLDGQIYQFDLNTGETVRISSDPNGSPGDGASENPVISDNGTVTVFVSNAGNLARIEPPETFQLYSYDSRTKKINLLSRNVHRTGGANHDIIFPVISADGSQAGFMSYATDLVTMDDKFQNDVFAVHTSGADPVQLVSLALSTSTSATAEGTSQVQADAVSADGRFVAFSSLASDLTPELANSDGNVFLRDLRSGITRLVSRSPDGVHPFPNASIFLGMSSDGRFVAFNGAKLSDPGFLRSIFLYDAVTGSNTVETILPNGSSASVNDGNLSADGRYLAFQVGGLVSSGVYVRDIPAQKTYSVTNYGNFEPGRFQGISPGGRYVLVYPNLRTALLFDWNAGIAQSLPAFGNYSRQFTANDEALLIYSPSAVTGPGAPSLYLHSLTNNTQIFITTNVLDAALSADGSTIVSWEQLPRLASHLVIHDLKSGVASEIPIGNTESTFKVNETPVLSGDGRFTVFSTASPLVGGSKTFHNVFLYDRVLTNLTLVSHTPAGKYGNFGSNHPSVSQDGRTIAFQSSASDLVENDRNVSLDVFVARIPITDSDNDGLDDGWELIRFGTLSASGADDSDHDGVPNLAEFLAGTDPRSAGSRFVIYPSVSLSNGRFEITWSAVAGKAYQLQFRTNLTTGEWTGVGPETAAISDGARSFDAQTHSERSGFYRVRIIE